VVLAVIAASAACVPGGGAEAEAPTRAIAKGSVDSARQLDQEGVRSFRAGRYNDAIAFFRAAYDLGGPSSELWNIVRCREGLDDPEGAAAAIDEYLGVKDLAPRDRADATREAQALRDRASTLTVTTNPPGATLFVDGKMAAGATPLSLEIRPGTHALALRREGYLAATRSVEARFGRAVIVTLDLERGSK
jgi:hypothetical protein